MDDLHRIAVVFPWPDLASGRWAPDDDPPHPLLGARFLAAIRLTQLDAGRGACGEEGVCLASNAGLFLRPALLGPAGHGGEGRSEVLTALARAPPFPSVVTDEPARPAGFRSAAASASGHAPSAMPAHVH